MKMNRNKKAFTLIEAIFATILIAIAVTGLLFATQNFSIVNARGIELSTADFLIEQIREMTASMEVVDPETGTDTFGAEESSIADYDDLDDFDTKSFNPAIDIDRQELTDFSSYTQNITVTNVNNANLEQAVSNHGSNIVRVTVTIQRQGNDICSASWLRTR